METTVKTSISLPKETWKKLKKYRNRSSVIYIALELYFDKEQDLEKAEEVYWEKVKKSLRGKTGEYISANPNGEEITDELLEEKLWK
ncbi:hypothetical protein HZA38_00500 [Candidatus Peregrinibacteria bacterium]|nr:hypothetical protein [Candidatus Peregrinibacteria bacterium]